MAVNFDPGTNSSYLSLASAPASAAALSMFAWFKAVNFSSNPVAIAILNSGTGDYFALGFDTGGANKVIASKHHFIFTDQARSADTLTTGTWLAAGAVWDASLHSTAYLNGVPGTQDTGAQVPTGLDSLQIGPHCTGCLAAVAIWNTDLSDAQMALLASGRNPKTIALPNLVFYDALLDDASKLINEFGADLTANPGNLGGFSTCATSPPLIGSWVPKVRHIVGQMQTLPPLVTLDTGFLGGYLGDYLGTYL